METLLVCKVSANWSLAIRVSYSTTLFVTGNEKQSEYGISSPSGLMIRTPAPLISIPEAPSTKLLNNDEEVLLKKIRESLFGHLPFEALNEGLQSRNLLRFDP